MLPRTMSDPEGQIEKAINGLFEQGLADPRGLPYHHVKVQEGGELLEGRGWVLPSQPDEASRFVIGWSGLIYPMGWRLVWIRTIGLRPNDWRFLTVSGLRPSVGILGMRTPI